MASTASTTSTSVNGSDSTSSDNTKVLVNDLTGGKPILSQLLGAVTSKDADAIDKVLGKNGYSVTLEGISKVLQTAGSGATFDIKMVAGLYTFQSPQDMTINVRMRIDPLSGRLFIQENWVGNSTDSKGNVIFNYNQMSYQLTFTVTFDSTGVEQPYQFSGLRGPIGSDATSWTEKVNGKQLIPQPPQPPAADWTGTPGWMQAGTIFTVFGGSVGLLLSIVALRKQINSDKAGDKAKEHMEKNFEGLKQQLRDISDRCAAAARSVADLSRPEERPNLAGQQRRIDSVVESSVNVHFESQLDAGSDFDAIDPHSIAHYVYEDVGQALRDSYIEQHGADIEAQVEPFFDILSDEDAGRSMNLIAGDRLAGVEMYARPAENSYLEAKIEAQLAKQQAERAAERGRNAASARDESQLQLDAAKARKTAAEQERKKYVDQFGSLPQEQRPEDYQTHLENISNEIERHDREAQDAAQSRAEKDDLARREQESAQAHEERAKEKQRESHALEPVTFHGD